MPRAHSPRRVRHLPGVTYFKPAGIPMRMLAEVALTLDEVEALRLADLTALHHEAAAKQMAVSRATFGRIIESARRKVADALISGKALRLGGGPVLLSSQLPGLLQQTKGKMKSMKIAVVTDNEKTISQHFGRARGFVVLTLKDGRIAHRETRLRTGGCDGHGHEENHEHDHTGGHTGHNCGALVELISDCGAVLVHRMGGGLYQRLQAADIRPVFTELQNIEEAVGALLAGTLTESQPQLCH